MTDTPIRWVDKSAFVAPVLPAELGVDPLLAGLVHCMAFLELSGDEAVDPDWAVEAMEYVATYIQRLSAPERKAVAAGLAKISAHARGKGASAEFIAFVDGFLQSCGLEEQEAE